ncbi:transcriptional regulator [Acidaminobacter sp. JC074]|uniref:helix-turn-helix transcriptional regulator n=1 Tax=Acidaminobacter sp. JC074 TaxID=2530199 RepID=UPI001F10E1DA|nr:helix-turn-helix domain-containing protein [Acidaminobacter sp. JC074]
MYNFADYLIDYLEFENISHNEFAKHLDINPSQLSMILNKKRKLSFDLMKKISMITPFTIEEIVKVESTYDIEKKIEEAFHKHNDTYKAYIKRYKYKQLEDYDEDIILKDIDNELQVVKDIMAYLRISSPFINKVDNVLFKSKHDKTELVNIWLEKCFRETKKQEIEEYTPNSINEIVKNIIQFAKRGIFNRDELTKLFNDNGIFLSIIEDLPGSKIRGAFKVLDTKPAIYITLKHKRPADVYFALLHELAHCKTDFNSAKSKSFISFEDNVLKEIPLAEKLADQKAFDWMINEMVFNEIEKVYTDEKFYNIINHYDIPEMFLVYRLAISKNVDFNFNNKLYQKHNHVF